MKMSRLAPFVVCVLSCLVVFSRNAVAGEMPVAYQATDDVVHGHKDGLALTLDVVDPNHLGITSGSSGGHLSLMAAMTGDDGKPDSKDPIERVSSQVQAVVAWFLPTDMINWAAPDGYKLIPLLRPGLFERMFGEITDLEAQLKSISPLYLVTKGSPPLLLIHGDADKAVPLQQSEIMKAKYEEQGAKVKLVVEPGGGHSSWPGIMDDYPSVWDWFDEHLK